MAMIGVFALVPALGLGPLHSPLLMALINYSGG